MGIAYNNQTLGRGELRFSLYKPSSYTPAGYRYLGNTPSFALTSNVQMLDHYGSDHGVREKDKSIPVQVDRMAKFDVDDIQLDNLAFFFFGASSIQSQTSGSYTETFTGMVPGLSYQLGVTPTNPTGIRSLSSVTVTVSSVAKTAGTDYVIDAVRGILTILPGSTITSSDSVVVAATKAAKSIDMVISSNTPVKGSLMFVADNPEGQNIDFLMPYVRLTPNGDFQLKAEQAWQQLPFNVEILTAPGLAAIYANGQPY